MRSYRGGICARTHVLCASGGTDPVAGSTSPMERTMPAKTAASLRATARANAPAVPRQGTPRAASDAEIAPYVGLPWRAGLLISVSFWCYLAMSELSRLSGDRLDATDHSWPFVTLLGPSWVLNADGHGWVALGTAADPGRLATWLVAFVVIDLILAGCLTLMALHLFDPLPGRRRVGRLVVVVAMAVQLVESTFTLAVAVALGGSGPGHGVPSGLAGVLAVVTGLKWLAVVFVLLGLVRRLFSVDGTQWRRRICRVAHSLLIHRFSLLPVVPIAALVLPSGPNIADQVPDVQRRWLDGWIGLVHGGAATVALLVLTVVVFVVGRLRCDWVWRRRAGTEVPHRPPSTLWLWLVGPAMVVVLAVVAALSHGLVLWHRVVYFSLPLILVAAVSAWVRRTQRPMVPSTPQTYPLRTVSTAIRAGDALALLVVVIGGLGLDRAFVAPAFLYPTGDRIRSWLLLALSVGAVVMPWLLEERVRRHLNRAARSRDLSSTLGGRAMRYFAHSTTPGIGTLGRGRVGEARLSIRRFRRLLVFLSLGTFGLLGVAPVAAARILGVVACLILALMAVTTIASTMLVMTQEHAPPEAFRLIVPNLRTTPVVVFLLGTVVFAASIGQSAHLHDLRGLADSPTAAGMAMPVRPALIAATDVATAGPAVGSGTPSSFATWLADPAACRTTVTVATSTGTRPVVLRPMVMLAADGGGIRAAFWTASAVQRLSAAGGGCGNSSTLFSGGASGGSVGLAVASNTTTPVTDVTAMSAPAALGAGAVGLTVRDLFIAATGVGLPVLFSDDVVERNLAATPAGTAPRVGWSDRWAWLDRAALIESVWETASPSMRQPFVGSAAPHGGTGQLVLTSTSVATGCRVFVSQDTLTRVAGASPSVLGDATGGTQPSCTGTDAPAASSFDLLDEFGATAPASGSSPGTSATSTEARCIADLANSTAGMATARFPYVTPSGDVGPCRGRSGQQLVDGGYTENSGIGTIVDLSPSWLAAVRSVNDATARSLATSSTGAGTPPELIVPIVVYLVDDGGRDVAAPASAPTSEALVPIIANSNAGRLQEDPQSLLQRAAALTAGTQLCDPSITGCAALGTAATTWAPRRVDVVYPETQPAVTAPLGWVLSKGSRDTMTEAMNRQASQTCAQAGRNDPICQRGYGRLADLLALLTVS